MPRRNSIFRRSVARILDHGFHGEEEAREAVKRVIRCTAKKNLGPKILGEIFLCVAQVCPKRWSTCWWTQTRQATKTQPPFPPELQVLFKVFSKMMWTFSDPNLLLLPSVTNWKTQTPSALLQLLSVRLMAGLALFPCLPQSMAAVTTLLPQLGFRKHWDEAIAPAAI